LARLSSCSAKLPEAFSLGVPAGILPEVTAAVLKCYVSAVIRLGQPMTKTELQIALAEAAQTDKRTAALFLDALSGLAYKALRKEGEFVPPGFGKLVKQKRKPRTGINPKTLQKIKIPAKDGPTSSRPAETVVKFRAAKAAKDAILGAKKESGFRGRHRYDSRRK
jgi:DNA-binding protein HU-beta